MTSPMLARLGAVIGLGILMLHGCTAPQAPLDAIPSAPEQLADTRARNEDSTVAKQASNNLAGNRFCINLYRTVASNGNNDIILSPYSVASTLSGLYAGSRGETRDELAAVIGLDGSDADVLGRYSETDAYLMSRVPPNAGDFRVANGIWLQKGSRLDQAFAKLHLSLKRSTVEECDFNHATEAASRINQWASEKTRGKIDEVVRSDDLSGRTRLLLANAVYFTGRWKVPFQAEDTRPAAFEYAPGKAVQVQMMSRYGAILRTFSNDSIRAVELQYCDTSLSMLLILPVKRNALRDVERQLTDDTIKGVMAGLRRSGLDKVSVPRFKFSSSLRLRTHLESLGLRRPFSPNADFSRLLSDSGYFLADVVHQSHIDVDEKGTVAAAVTGAVGNGSLRPPDEFVADQPFLCVVVDSATGLVLFIVRYSASSLVSAAK